MNKLKLIIRREFLAKVKNKSFIVMTVLSPLLMVGLVMLIFYLNEKNSEDIRTIAIVDESNLIVPVFKDTESTKYKDLTLLDIEREAFMSLCAERKTLERIEHMLKTGKPLRN